MRLLITGGTGFLGSYLTRYAILEKGAAHVFVFDKYVDAGRIEDVLDNVTIIEGDISDSNAVRAAVAMNGIDRIAHFASILGSPGHGQMLPYVRVQCVGTANIFEAARTEGVKRVLFASSIAAYGKQVAGVLTEDILVNPTEPYGSFKVWAEALGRHYTQELGLDVVSLRFGSTYGLGRAQRGSYRSGLLSPQQGVHYMARVEAAARGNSIVMPNNSTMADWTYAMDAAQAAWLGLTEALPNHLYNVCSTRGSVGAYTQALRELLPEAEINVSETEPPGNSHPPMDGSRLKSELGFAPKFSINAGVADYIARIRAYDRYYKCQSSPGLT